MANSVHRHAFTGTESLLQVLRGLPAAVRSEILEPACVKAAKPIQTAISALAPNDTGALKRSIRVKGVSDKTKGTAAALIGPDRSYYRNGRKVAKNADRRGANKPANYAHLVEFGHVSGANSIGFGGFAKGTSVRKKTAEAKSFVLPRPFMRPGFAAGAPFAEALLVQEIGGSIEKYRAKLVARGAHAS